MCLYLLHYKLKDYVSLVLSCLHICVFTLLSFRVGDVPTLQYFIPTRIFPFLYFIHFICHFSGLFFPLLLCDIFWVCHIFHLIFALTSSWGWTSSIHVYLTCQFVQTLIRLFLIYDYFLWSVINKLEAWSKLVLLQYLALPFMYINMEMPDSCRRGEQVRPADLFVCLFSTLCIYLWNSGNTSLTSKATHLSWQTSDPLNIRWIKGLTFVDRVTHDFSELRVILYALLCS